MERAKRKALHRKGIYPPAVPHVYTRRKLGDPPGFYGAQEQYMLPAHVRPQPSKKD